MDHQTNLLQARNRRRLESQGKLVGGFVTGSVLDDYDTPLRGACHAGIKRGDLDFDFAAHAAGKNAKQKVNLGAPCLEQEDAGNYSIDLDTFEEVGRQHKASLEMFFPGAGVNYGKLLRLTRRRAKSYGIEVALRFERQHRIMAANTHRTRQMNVAHFVWEKIL